MDSMQDLVEPDLDEDNEDKPTVAVGEVGEVELIFAKELGTFAVEVEDSEVELLGLEEVVVDFPEELLTTVWTVDAILVDHISVALDSVGVDTEEVE